jgi:NitT/TauT family transport system substrate-binding protein
MEGKMISVSFKRRILAASMVAGALLATSGNSYALDKVVVAQGIPQLTPAFAFMSSVPMEMGYFKEEGLDVEVATTPGTAAAMQLVVGGRVDVAMGNPTGAMIAIQKGADVSAYYTGQRGDIFGVGLPQSNNLKSLADLKGKNVGVSSFASGGTNYAKGLLGQAGLKEGDYSLVEIGVGARAVAALQSNQVQALSLWDEVYVQMAQQGIKMSQVIQDPRAAQFLGASLVVRKDDLVKRRKVLVGLARAIAKGQIFHEQNPEATVRIHWKVYPDSAPRAGVTDEEVKKAVEVINIHTHLQSRDIMKTGRWGDVPTADLEKFQDYLVTTGVVPERIDVSRYNTNDLIAEINNFDAAAVAKSAREYKIK